ncbi:hypothetical protein ANG_1603 [Streptococcus anginosus subsp. whileyi MAS624]|nr:hypothetical protein ANG_1603 [Streptococcus anginosus subsp. whileyi MAS624]GAD36460.1 hypothetical protein ANG1_0647 [Streptococcus anginosus SK52 = DSM 20563]GAD40229.1 hypothetical protein ANG3_0692 [Streptococcus intermedius SK54 = ATCC 27335]
MIKLVAFDMDGTFLHSDNTYDVKRFEKIYRALLARKRYKSSRHFRQSVCPTGFIFSKISG